MKLKRITSGIMAAVMAVTVVGTPVGDMIPAIGVLRRNRQILSRVQLMRQDTAIR